MCVCVRKQTKVGIQPCSNCVVQHMCVCVCMCLCVWLLAFLRRSVLTGKIHSKALKQRIYIMVFNHHFIGSPHLDSWEAQSKNHHVTITGLCEACHRLHGNEHHNLKRKCEMYLPMHLPLLPEEAPAVNSPVKATQLWRICLMNSGLPKYVDRFPRGWPPEPWCRA